ncbi:hypothetical protein D6783_04285 [Candidatus Woesearchaeota archaeon]|nr:MAG: hypothetical protein D6783_04285 [Candidatus Woesearchaeota archaeon]
MEIIKVVFVNAMLNTVIFFFVIHLVFSLFSIRALWSIYAATAYFVYTTYKQVRKVRLHVIEEKNPQVREILRTANDNMDEDNLMVRAMFRDLMERMKTVSGGSFLEARVVVVKILIITFLSVAIVLLASFRVDLGLFDNPFDAVFAWWQQGGNQTGQVSEELEDPLAARIGKVDTEIVFTPHLNKINFNEVEDPDEVKKKAENFFYDEGVEAVADAPSNQKAIREAALASEYSQKVKELQ